MTSTTTPPTADRPPAVDPPTPPAARPAFDPALDPAPAHLRVITQEMADRWAGKHVAWSWDGTEILAGADTIEELADLLDRSGVDPSRVVFSYMDEPGTSYL